MRNILFLILYFSLSTQAQVVEVVGSMIEDLKSEEQKLNLIMSSDTSLVARHYEMACLFSLKAEYEKAFEHLTKSYQYKMSLLPKWERGSELSKVLQGRL